MEINPLLKDSPEVVNKDPYSGGWMVKIKIVDPAELNSLLDSSKYQEMVGQ